jgi:copper oxidase (laccase) domain-containing protein
VAWLGPAIGPREYEVGSDVRDAFVFHDLVAHDSGHADPAAIDAFELRANAKYLADLYHLARRRLERVGVTDVHGGDACTYTERKRFFSLSGFQRGVAPLVNGGANNPHAKPVYFEYLPTN